MMNNLMGEELNDLGLHCENLVVTLVTLITFLLQSLVGQAWYIQLSFLTNTMAALLQKYSGLS